MGFTRDGLTWATVLLVALSIGVAVFCTRLSEPELIPARDLAGAEPASGPKPTLVSHTPSSPGARASRGADTCEFGEVLLIAAHSDPSQSTAAIRTPDGVTNNRQPGQSIAGFVVDSIHFDRVELRRGQERCTMYIGERRDEQVEMREATQAQSPRLDVQVI